MAKGVIYVLIGLIIFSFLAYSAPQTTTNDLLPYIEYSKGDSYRIGIQLMEHGEPTTITIKGVGTPQVYPKYATFMVLADYSPYQRNNLPQENMTFAYNCGGGETTIELDETRTWRQNGYYYVSSEYSYDNSEVISFSNNDEEKYILFSKTCTLTIEGGFAYIISQMEFETEKSLSPAFSLPYSALSELVENIVELIFTVYETLNIGLIVAGLFIFLFLPVFAYKSFKYIAGGTTKLWR